MSKFINNWFRGDLVEFSFCLFALRETLGSLF